MKKIIIISISLMIFLITGCNQENNTQETEAVMVSVKARIIQKSDLDIEDSYTANIEGEKQATIYAKISETVNKINFYENSSVKKGDIIVELDENATESGYLQSKALYLNAKKNYDKMENLYSQGAISEYEFDAAKTDYQVKLAAYEAASKLIYLQSPINGVITGLYVNEGDFVQLGQKIAVVASTEKIIVVCELNQQQITDINVADDVYLLDKNNEKLFGKVISLASSSDPLTRTFKLETIFNNPGHSFQVGSFTRLYFVSQTLSDVILVPRQAVLQQEDKNIVFVANGDQAARKEVTISRESNGLLVVDNGLEVGDTLITLGQEYLEDSMKVNITEWETK